MYVCGETDGGKRYVEERLLVGACRYEVVWVCFRGFAASVWGEVTCDQA